MDKLIITIAPTGSVPQKKNTPHVPITPEEIIESGVRCEAAGASIFHVHIRNSVYETPSTDYRLFSEVVDGLKSETNLVIQISTGGRAGAGYKLRSERLKLRPEMASLTTGSVNFPNSVYENSPELIEKLAKDMRKYNIKPEMEIFDISMINNALNLVNKNLVTPPLHFDFIMGLQGAIPATVENLLHMKNSIPPGSTWSAAGIGASQLPMTTFAILCGGHVRVGLEDNIYYLRGELSTNERLVERVVRISRELGRDIATPDQAREILNLKMQK